MIWTSYTSFVPFPSTSPHDVSQENYEAGFRESARIFFEREERKVRSSILIAHSDQPRQDARRPFVLISVNGKEASWGSGAASLLVVYEVLVMVGVEGPPTGLVRFRESGRRAGAKPSLFCPRLDVFWNLC